MYWLYTSHGVSLRTPHLIPQNITALLGFFGFRVFLGGVYNALCFYF